MLETGSIGFATAFLAGVISFLSPCVLPLVPGYLSYVAGTSLESLRDRTASRLQALLYAVCFVLGFSVVFIAFGASATALGGLLLSWRYELGIAAGIIVLLFGLHLAGLLPLHWLEREARFHAEVRGGRVVGAFLLGLAFAFGWTPCIGPVLAAILAVAASEMTVHKGAGLLAVYSLGLGIPFVLAAFAIKPFLRFAASMRHRLRVVEMVMGGLLVLTGLAFLTGKMSMLAFWLLETFPVLGSIG